ncbi:unannotated protein [freshwater metagenome]|uniref:Unannotated protein n=1 Tax=freshwater metagenome TaxID=449393 RepID=A0A6J7I821_9ZZZZ
MTLAVLAAGCAVGCAFAALAQLLGALRHARSLPRERRGPVRLVLRAMATPPAPAGLARLLDAADAAGRLSVRELMAIKSLTAGGCLLVLMLGASALPGRLGVLLLVLGPVGAFHAPDLLLLRRARERAARVRAEAPQVIDRVRLAVGAGLPAGQALERAARHGEGPLALELRRAAAAMAVGLPQSAALRRVVERCPVPEVEALAALVGRSARHGTPAGPALAALAAGARSERARRIRDRAQRAAPKIQLVVALLLVPAALCLIAAAILAGLR